MGILKVLRVSLSQKKFILNGLPLFALLFALVSVVMIWSESFATEKWGTYDSDPIEILSQVKDKANGDNSNYAIQDTALDGITDQQWWYDSEYKLANTLVYVKNNVHRYLQWMMYIGLSAAAILLIVQWLLMVTNALHKQWEFSEIKKNVTKIFIWVFFMTGFYYFIQLVLSLLVMLFGEG